MKDENKNTRMLKLFQKIICSLTCIEKITNNKDIKKTASIYLDDFIQIYIKFKANFNINFPFKEQEIIDFCNECYDKVDIFDLAEDLEYGLKELSEIKKTI